MKSSIWRAIAAAVLVFWAGIAAAEPANPIPFSVLVKDQRSCINSNGGRNANSPVKHAYCLCTTMEMRQRIDLTAYAALEAKARDAYDSEGNLDQQKANALTELRQIADICLARIRAEQQR